MADRIEFYQDDEWTAVYLNGKLEIVGDNYLANEWLRIHVGVTCFDDDAFMLGGKDYDDVAKTLDAVHEYQMKRANNNKKVEELRKQARELIEKAKELEEYFNG